MPRIAIVAALGREVAPLIRDWRRRVVEHDGRQYQFFENGNVSLVCGGIGPAAARRATEAIIRASQADHVLSVGFAGALDSKLRAGDVLQPRTVLNAADSSRTDTGRGEGVLVSFDSVAGRDQKHKLRTAYGAAAVDMEAASVALGAASRGVSFAAVKAISDEYDASLPPLDRFVKADGSFDTLSFTIHAVLRPWLWPATVALARHSSRASRALCSALEQYLRSFPADAAPSR